MRKTLTVLRHEFTQTVKRRAFIIMTLAIPLLLVLGYGIYQGVQHLSQPGEPEELKIGYVDEAGGFDLYPSQGDVIFLPKGTEEEARSELLSHQIDEYFVIPRTYLENGLVVRYTLESALEVPDKTWTSIKDFLLLNLLAGDVSPEVLERAKAPLGLQSIQLDETGQPTPPEDEITKYLLPIVFALLFIFSVFFSSGYLLQSVTEEKENRVIEVILSSVSARQLLAGKVLGLGAAGLLQIAVWLAAIRVFAEVASVNIPALSDLSISTGLLVLTLIYFLLGYLMFAAFYAGVGSIGATAREAQGWSAIFAIPAILPMYLSPLINDDPTGVLARVVTLFPLTAPTAAMVRLPSNSMSAWEIGASLAILTASIVLAMWTAAKVFRVFLLMYGKTPGLREIVKYVREA
jgi:ABC-2 type transport system permease protein